MAIRIEDTVETAISKNDSPEHASPKCTLCCNITGIKDDDLPNDFHTIHRVI